MEHRGLGVQVRLTRVAGSAPGRLWSAARAELTRPKFSPGDLSSARDQRTPVRKEGRYGRGNVAGASPQATITQLKKQAKLRQAARSGDREARRRVALGTDTSPTEWDGLALRDAQFVLAREYGFDGWNQLSAEGERMIEQRDLHRWFGVQLNNGMWDAIEDPSVGPDSPTDTKERLLYSAYASAYHWIHVGNEANLPVASTSSPGWRSRSASTNWGSATPGAVWS